MEVMNNKNVPATWHMAEVVSRCRNSYLVRYESYPGAHDKMVEKVLQNFVRPCPPLMHSLEDCAAGDFVEVFHENSWKIAAILKKMDEKEGNTRSMMKNLYLVRLLGSSYVLVVGRWNIRMRQTWHDGKWNLMGKRSQDGRYVMASELSTSNSNYQEPQFNAWAKDQSKNHFEDFQDDAMLGESPTAASRPLKRTLPYFSSIKAHNQHAKKSRAIEKEGQNHHERGEFVACPKEVLGEKNTPASHHYIISNGCYQMKGPSPNDVPAGDYLLRSSEPSSSDSDCCSVGSCSATKQGSMRETSSLPPKEGFEGYTVGALEASLCCFQLFNNDAREFATSLMALNFG